MLAEEHAAQALGSKKIGSGALDAETFDSLAALAFELLFGKGRVARKVREQFEQSLRKFSYARDPDSARIGAGDCGQIRAHAPEIFFDAAQGPCGGAGARDGCSHLGQSRRRMGDTGVSAAEEKLRGNLRERVRFDKNNLHAVRECANGALRPSDRPFRP
jgi:hypothetical protein